jgi:hypothetical protein
MEEFLMKKTARVSLVLIFMLGLTLLIVPNTAQAIKTDSSAIAGGEWSTGTSVDVSKMMDQKPDWLQLLSKNGVKVDGAGELCHPLRGGQFGWVGEIREYKKGEWIRIPTTNDWVPSLDGVYTACAQVSKAGTYALFGYYVRPVGKVKDTKDDGFDCATVGWDVHLENLAKTTLRLYGTISGLPDGTSVDFSIDSSKTDPSSIGGSASFTLAADGSYDYTHLAYAPDARNVYITYSIPAYGCSYSFDHGF